MVNTATITIPGLENLREIGRGGTAVVYAARETAFQRDVAVKVMTTWGDALARARFEREARTIGQLSTHPGIVTVYSSGLLGNGSPYLVMEYVPNTLESLMLNQHRLSWQTVARFGMQIAEALDYVHANGVLHRDLKPGNVFVTDDGRALVGDFGIAAAAVADPGEDGHPQVLTPAFAAPELWEGAAGDVRTDVYGLAATLHAAVAGQPAVQAAYDEPIPAIMQRVLAGDLAELPAELAPPAFRDLISRALARSPDERPSTAGELGRALARVLATEGPAAPATPAAPAQPPLDTREVVPIRSGFRYVQQPQSTDDVLPWFGHDELVQRLTERLLYAEGGAYLLTGFRGVGKSTVVARALAAARTHPLESELVSIQLNVARPLPAPHLLLVDATRQLYETFLELDQLGDLGDVSLRALELAYIRTSAVLKQRTAKSTEAGGALGLSGLDLSGKRTSSHEVEQAFETYTEADIEHDFLRITRLLQDPAGRRRKRRFPRRDALAARRQVVVVLDEIDKLTAMPKGRAFLEEMLAHLKNVLSARSVHFIFVAGPDLHQEFSRQGQRGHSVFESIFSLHLYVPALWQAASAMIPALVEPTGMHAIPQTLAAGLRFRSRGVTRRLLQQFNELVVWHNGAARLRLDQRERELLRLHAEIDETILAAVALSSDQIPGTIEDDRARLATYVLVSWILSGVQPQVTAPEIRRAMGAIEGADSTDLDIADEALRLSSRHVESLLAFLADRGVLSRSPTLLPDVPQSYALAPTLRHRLVQLSQLPRLALPGPPSEAPLPRSPYVTGPLAGDTRYRTVEPSLPAPPPWYQPPPSSWESVDPTPSPSSEPPPAPQPQPPPPPPFPGYAPPPPSWSTSEPHPAPPPPLPTYEPPPPGHPTGPVPWVSPEPSPWASGPPPPGAPAPPPPVQSPPLMPQQPWSNELAAGRYVLQEILAYGGFGTTYRGRDRTAERDVAVRVLEAPTLVANDAARKRFLREGKLVQRLDHPNVFKVLDIVEEHDGRVALVTELLFGRPLGQVISESPLSIPEAVIIVRRLLDAAGYLHDEGVGRLDPTPESVVLKSDGTPIITDLGSARRYAERATVLTVDGLVGSITYAAPEALSGARPTVRSDVYGFGMLLYRLLGGRLPWNEATAPMRTILHRKIKGLDLEIEGVSPKVLAVIRKATALSPDDRYGSAAEMSSALEEATAELTDPDDEDHTASRSAG